VSSTSSIRNPGALNHTTAALPSPTGAPPWNSDRQTVTRFTEAPTLIRGCSSQFQRAEPVIATVWNSLVDRVDVAGRACRRPRNGPPDIGRRVGISFAAKLVRPWQPGCYDKQIERRTEGNCGISLE
jgi:hypothetical protein